MKRSDETKLEYLKRTIKSMHEYADFMQDLAENSTDEIDIIVRKRIAQEIYYWLKWLEEI